MQSDIPMRCPGGPRQIPNVIRNEMNYDCVTNYPDRHRFLGHADERHTCWTVLDSRSTLKDQRDGHQNDISPTVSKFVLYSFSSLIS